LLIKESGFEVLSCSQHQAAKVKTGAEISRGHGGAFFEAFQRFRYLGEGELDSS